jgi:replicative DNA helicase
MNGGFMNNPPPHNIESEMALLGAILLGGAPVLSKVLPYIPDGGSFYRQAHGVIYDAFAKIGSENNPIDIVSTMDTLNSRSELDKVGGIAFLMQLGEFVPTTSNAEYYAKIVRRDSDLRRIIEHSMEIIDLGYSSDLEPQEIIDKATLMMGSITKDGNTEVHHVDDHIAEAINDIASRQNDHKVSGISSGYKALDDMIGGWRKGEMIVLGARPSMGKSAFAMALARNASRQNAKTLFMSIEMSMQMTIHRLLSLESGIDLRRISNSKLTDSEILHLRGARANLFDAPLFVAAKNPMSMSDIRSLCIRFKEKNGLDFVIIDFLQMVETKGVNRITEIGAVSRGVKQLARELDIPVLILSSLNRASDKRDDKRPTLPDLRESGDIESDADVVAFLYRASYYSAVEPSPIDEIEVIIRKNRNGPIGTVSLEYRPAIGAFSELSFGGL